MNFQVSEFPSGLPNSNNIYTLSTNFMIPEFNRSYVPELPKDVPSDSRGRLPPELMYDIIYEVFIDNVHTMVSALTSEKFTHQGKSALEIQMDYKIEKAFVKRFSSVSHVFRHILQKLLSEVCELGGVLLDPALAYVICSLSL